MEIDTVRAAVDRLKHDGLSVAFAESCTGGLVSAALTQISGASDVFGFGAVTYSNEMKKKVLGVRSETLREHGAVSEQTARQMAKGVAAFADADIGVGITGIAGPGSDDTEKPVGLIYVSIWTRDGFEKVEELRNSFSGDVRTQNRESAVEASFRLLNEYLELRENHDEQ